MLSYVSRRRRWWKLLKTLDGSIELSEPMRVELLLELSGLSRQEIIVIKACAPDAKSFESVAATLVEQYSGVHLREGRSLGQPNLLNSGNLQTRSGRNSAYRPKGKGKTYKAYTADAWYEEDVYYEEDQDQEEDFNEASYQAFDEETAPGYPEHPENDDYPSPKQLPLTALRSPQKLDMLYSYNWQPMQPLVRLKAKARVSPRKVRVKERARLFVVT